MKSAMFLAAMLALSGLLAVATATDKVEAKTSYSGGSKYKHYNYPKKHYEPKYEKHDNYDNGYKGDYKPEYKDEYYQGEYQPYYETYEPDYDPSYSGPKHYKTKTFRLYASDVVTPCGKIAGDFHCGSESHSEQVVESASITRPLFADKELLHQVAVLYQTGLVAKSGPQAIGGTAEGRMVWQQSFRFLDNTGSIQTQGDDSGWANAKYSNRAVTGGTGRYAGVTGYMTRTNTGEEHDYDLPPSGPGNPKFYEFVLLNWNGYGYGY